MLRLQLQMKQLIRIIVVGVQKINPKSMISKKQIEELQRRVSEKRQDIDHCVHDGNSNRDNQRGTEPAKVSVSAFVVEEHEVKSEKAESDPMPRPSDDDGFYHVLFIWCDIYGLVCLSSKLKVKHIRAEHGLTCTACPLKFTSHHTYMNNTKNDHKGLKSCIQDPCSECGHRGQVIAHTKRQHGVVVPSDSGCGKPKQLIWPCRACKWNSTSFEAKDAHIRQSHAYTCKVYRATYPQFQSLRQHCIAKHRIDPSGEEEEEGAGAGGSRSSGQGSALMAKNISGWNKG